VDCGYIGASGDLRKAAQITGRNHVRGDASNGSDLALTQLQRELWLQ
jgi:hypothetical protein